jgi:hypothetical protein
MADPLSIRPGERAEIELPFSEVCMHMKVAGKRLPVELVETPQYLSEHFSYHAQIFDADGNKMGAPVTLGEAGIYRTDANFFYHY